jgi:hypothetical protein
MIKNLFIYQLEFSRQNLFRILKDMTEEEVKIIPEGFNNSILWNAGHILMPIEQFHFTGTHRQAAVPSEYMALFWRGTKPADWRSDPPSLQTVVEHIAEQTLRVRNELSGHLDEPLDTPMEFPGMPPIQTAGDLMSMSLYHEALHIGYIKALKKTIRYS